MKLHSFYVAIFSSIWAVTFFSCSGWRNIIWIFSNLRVSPFKKSIRIGRFCPKLRYFTDQNGPKGGPHKNKFWLFSNTKMNVTSSYSRRSRWKKKWVIFLFSMCLFWVMVLKISRRVHFSNFVLILSRHLSLLKLFTYMHMNVLITLFQKIILFIAVWATVHEILAIRVSKKMLNQQKF